METKDSMIRRGLIAGLSVGAITVGVCGLFGIYSAVLGEFRLSPQTFGYVHFADGLARLYWFRADQGAALVVSPDGRFVSIRRASDGQRLLVYRHGTPGAIPDYGVYWRDMRVGRANPLGKVLMSGFRMPVSALVGLLVVYPLFTVGRRRWRAMRRPPEGCCTTCGYNLQGNQTGVCPECGQAVRCRVCGYEWTGPPGDACPECEHPFAVGAD